MRFNEKSLGHANLYEGQDDGGGVYWFKIFG